MRPRIVSRPPFRRQPPNGITPAREKATHASDTQRAQMAALAVTGAPPPRPDGIGHAQVGQVEGGCQSLRIPQTPKHPNVQAFSDLLAEGDVAAVEDDRDAVERHRPALLPEVPRPCEVAVLRVARELRRRVRLQLREGRRRGRSSSTTRTFTTLPSSLPSPPAGPA